MIKLTKPKRRYAYGDYMDKPPVQGGSSIFGQYGTFNQDVNSVLSSQDLLPNNNAEILKQQKFNTTKPEPNWKPNWNQISGYTQTIGSGLSDSKEFDSQSSYIQSRNKTKQNTDAALGAVSSVFPVVGGFMKLGEGIGENTMDKNGIYKNKTGQFIDQNLNPVTGIQGVSDTLKSKDVGAWVSQLTAGVSDLFGTKSASQQRAIKAKETMDRQAAWEKEKQYQNVLANYPTQGYGKYGMKFSNGGNLPSPIDGSGVNQLASNVAQYQGDTHENGGIQLDNGAEIEDEEVVKDDMVLSDRLQPTNEIKHSMKGLNINLRSNDTYASLAERLGTKKGEFESKLKSTRLGEAGTAKLMIERYDKAVDNLFQDQQMNKIQNKVGTYAYGGPLEEGIPKEKSLSFKTQEEHINYYRPLAVEKMTPEDKAIYEETVKTKGQEYGDTWIASRGGLPAFIPNQKQAKVITYSNNSLPSKFNNKTTNGGYRYSAMGGKGLPDKNSITAIPSFGKGGQFLDNLNDNSGNIYNGLGYLANNLQINQLETSYSPELVKNPAFTYRDRTNFLRNEFGKQFTTASKGLNQSNSQDNIALKSSMYASTLNGLNGALDNEAQRKDNLDFQYNQLANRTSAQNAQILNYNKEYGISGRNNQRALRQNNTDSLIRGVMGNKTQKDLQQLDWDKAYIQALSSGDTGVAQRLIDNLPPDIKKRRFGNYNYKIR